LALYNTFSAPNRPKIPHLLSLPNELLLDIARSILSIARPHDLNSLVRINRRLYAVLNDLLYQDDLGDPGSFLTWAAKRNRPETAARALAAGADPNTASEELGDLPPIFDAALRGNLAVIEVLLAALGIDPNGWTPGWPTPLMAAASEGHEKVVRALLAARSIDPNIRTECPRRSNRTRWTGETALGMAAREGHASTVRLLLTTAHSLGVEFDSRNCFGQTPLRLAAERVMHFIYPPRCSSNLHGIPSSRLP
jgi:hypothetical protein